MLRNTYRLLAHGYSLLVRIADGLRSVAKNGRAVLEGQATAARSLKRLSENQKQAAATAADTVKHVAAIPELTVAVAGVARAVAQLQEAVADLRAGNATIQDELEDVRTESRAGLRQYHLQLGRLARAVQQAEATGSPDPHLASRSIPLDPPATAIRRWDDIGVAHPDPDGREWRQLDACPVCGHGVLTVVNPWNKLLLLEQAPDDGSVRYDYALCHGCGVVSATRRPSGSRYHFLLEHFGEVTAKRGGGREISNPVLNPYPLDDADREKLRQLSSAGVFVSDLSETARAKAYLPGLLRDRFESSGHVDIIGSLLQPRGARVLEVRAKTGALMDGLRRNWDCDVYSMPIWESQQWLVREFYGIPVSPPIDFDLFSIPFPGPFDLIVCQHMMTHALRPAEFLRELRRVLKPGGHIYLYNEPDDVEFLGKGQSMIAHLNPLHMQAFDQESLARGLAANAFEVVFLKRHDLEHVCLARAADIAMTPMEPSALQKRMSLYQKAYDRSILRMDEALRPRVAAEWSAVVERAVAAGVAEFDRAGRLRLVAP
jgi:SAM-dependent methyltransferase